MRALRHLDCELVRVQPTASSQWSSVTAAPKGATGPPEVLAFTDESLGQIAVAATAVAPDERKAWLAGVARRLDQPAPRALAPSTLPTRRWRKRRQDGLVCLNVVIDEALLVVGLVDHNLLDPLRADDKCALAAAAGEALVRFCNSDASLPDAEIKDRLRVRLLAAVRRMTRARLSSSNPTRARAPKGRRRS